MTKSELPMDVLDNSKYERASCTVIATHVALGITYEDAYKRLALLGRKPKCGVVFMRYAEQLGFVMMPELSCKRLGNVMPELSNGRYIVRVSAHVFAVVDGVIVDCNVGSSNPNQIVKMVYQPYDQAMKISAG